MGRINVTSPIFEEPQGSNHALLDNGKALLLLKMEEKRDALRRRPMLNLPG